MAPLPKFLSYREQEFWKKRFDPQTHLTIQEIEDLFDLDRSNYASAQIKLKWNLDNNCLTKDDKGLLTGAQEVTKVEGDFSSSWLTIVVVTRAHHINFEKQKRRYESKRN